jgi:hypothetical protein
MSFEQIILENLKIARVQQTHKENKINFLSLTPWPGYYICAEGRYFESSEERVRKIGGHFHRYLFGGTPVRQVIRIMRIGIGVAI